MSASACVRIILRRTYVAVEEEDTFHSDCPKSFPARNRLRDKNCDGGGSSAVNLPHAAVAAHSSNSLVALAERAKNCRICIFRLGLGFSSSVAKESERVENSKGIRGTGRPPEAFSYNNSTLLLPFGGGGPTTVFW